MCSSKNDAGWMEVGAEDVVECKVGCKPTTEDEEPARVSKWSLRA
jgi:hypothetical protein